MQERQPASALIAGRGGRPRPRLALLGAIAAVVVAVDQITKTLAVRHLDRPVHLLWTLQLNLVYNRGGAFGLGNGLVPFFVVAAIVLTFGLIGMGTHLRSRRASLAVGLLIGGAIGNLGDRLFRDAAGGVVDFVDLRWWPVFNVADACIVCGGILLVLSGQQLAGQQPSDPPLVDSPEGQAVADAPD